MINRPRSDLPITAWLRRLSTKPFFALAAVAFIAFLCAPPGDWRLMAAASTAAFINIAVILLSFREWPTGIAAAGLAMNSLQQAAGLALLCISGVLGYLDDLTFYRILNGAEGRVLLMLVLVPLALLLVLSFRRLLRPDRRPRVTDSEHTAALDRRLPLLLLCSAVFSLMFWVGGELSFGLVKSVFLTLQRAFFFVPFLAGFYFRISRVTTITWLFVVAVNLGLGIATGSRGPAFMPFILYSIGMICGATFRQRLALLSILGVLAIPGIYVFGMIEVIRTDVGRLEVSKLSLSTVTQVVSELGSKKGNARDAYEEIPAVVRTNIRGLNWPNFVVAAVAGRSGSYRGYADLPEQLWASMNVVSLTGQMSEYYNEGLWNLRAADYGFLVTTETSVEFGILAESWDRGGPLGTFAYALVAMILLALTEAGAHRWLSKSPALCAITVSVIFSTAFWVLNVYNLPMALRQMVVNLVVCFAIFGTLNVLLAHVAGPSLKRGFEMEPRQRERPRF